MMNAYFQLWLVNRRDEYRKNTNHHFSTHHCQLSPLSMPATGAITSDSWPWAERGGHLSVQAPGSSGHRSQSAASSTCWRLHAVSSRRIHPQGARWRPLSPVLASGDWRHGVPGSSCGEPCAAGGHSFASYDVRIGTEYTTSPPGEQALLFIFWTW